jgi:hypothetical protein
VAVLDEFDTVAHSRVAAAGRAYRSEADASAEGPAIDAYYERVLTTLSQQVQPAASQSAMAKDVLGAIARACERPVCPTCSGSKETWCRWTESTGSDDAKRMTAGGLCIRTITGLFEWAHQLASQAYARACGKTRATPLLCTAYGQRNSQLELAIDAVTAESSRNARGRRVVTIILEPKTFWVLDYLSLPYVLMHECVAHAYCGVNVTDEEAELSKSFHEGWMDCVAAGLLEQSLNVAQDTGSVIEFPTEVWKQTDIVRRTRFNASRPSRPADVSKWIEGERAFHTLWHLFALAFGEECEDWTRASRESRDALIKLSLQINGSTITHEARQRFVQAILRSFARIVPAQRRSALLSNIQVLDIISNYSTDHDSAKFVRQIADLRP